MEFIINPSLLREELGLLTPVIERKAAIPVLSKIKMETNASGEIFFTATDLDVTMLSRQVTDVLQTGAILVEGKKLYDISRELPNEPIHFSLDKNGQIEIRYKKGRHKLGTVGAEQFPEVPKVPTINNRACASPPSFCAKRFAARLLRSRPSRAGSRLAARKSWWMIRV